MAHRTRKNAPEVQGLLTVEQTAGRLGVSERFVWQLMARGQLTPIRFGRRCTRVDAAEVAAMIERARAKGAK